VIPSQWAYLRGPAEPQRGRRAEAHVKARPGGLGTRLLCAGRLRAAPAPRRRRARRAGRRADPVRASALSARNAAGSPAPTARKVCTASLAESSVWHCERPWRTAWRQALADSHLGRAERAQRPRAKSSALPAEYSFIQLPDARHQRPHRTFDYMWPGHGVAEVICRASSTIPHPAIFWTRTVARRLISGSGARSR